VTSSDCRTGSWPNSARLDLLEMKPIILSLSLWTEGGRKGGEGGREGGVSNHICPCFGRRSDHTQPSLSLPPSFDPNLPARTQLRVSHDDSVVCKVHGVLRPTLNACRRITDDEVEFPSHFREHFADSIDGEGVFVLGLGGGQEVEVGVAFVFDHGLLERAVPVEDVNEVEDHSSFRALGWREGEWREEGRGD